jgi:NADH-quinone oxidoreductase subunit A
MTEQWVPALIFIALAAAGPVGMLAASWVLRARRSQREPVTFENYECGEQPDGLAWIRFHPRYYVVALVFVLFDVEAAFLFPWALNIRDAGLFAIVDMAVFLSILLAGWAYAVRKGAIKWQ